MCIIAGTSNQAAYCDVIRETTVVRISSSLRVPRSVCPCPQPAAMWRLLGAPGGPCQQISCAEAPSCVTGAEPRILV